MTSLSVVIPCYNEAKVLKRNVAKVRKQLKSFELEIILIDDGSTDNTWDKIMDELRVGDTFGLRSYQNRGKGFAVQTGCRCAKNELILILDADLSIQPRNAFKALQKVALPLPRELKFFKPPYPSDKKIMDTQANSLVIKAHRRQVISQPWHRIVAGKVWQGLVYLVTGINGDTQSPFTLLRVPPGFFYDLKIEGFAYDVELLYKAKRQGIPIYWVEMDYFNDPDSTVTLKKTVRMFFDLLRIRFRPRKSR